MSARILVVDDDPTNIILISSYLRSHYYIVDGACNTSQAAEKMREAKPHLIILDAIMPEENGFNFASRIKMDPEYWDIPIIMVTALDTQNDKRQALVCGIDDFLVKPVNPRRLSIRVKSLLNQKMSIDIIRDVSVNNNNFSSQLAPSLYPSERANIALLSKDYNFIANFEFSSRHVFDFFEDKDTFIHHLNSSNYDLAIVDFVSTHYEPCQFCAEYMVSEHGRRLPIIAVCRENQEKKEIDLLKKLLDIGVSEAFSKTITPVEMELRIATQIRYKRYFDMLLCNFNESARMACTDSLTGVYNRYYFVNAINKLIDDAKHDKTSLCVALFDIDNFKDINDTYGHNVGDEVLRLFADKIMDRLEAKHLLCRYGGEEFALVMPDTDIKTCQDFVNGILKLFKVGTLTCYQEPIKVTFSAGISELLASDTSFQWIVNRADKALYRAKNQGRRRVCVHYTDISDNVIPFPVREVC